MPTFKESMLVGMFPKKKKIIKIPPFIIEGNCKLRIVHFIKITLFYMSYKRFLEINHSHELMSMQDKREKWSFFSAPEFCLQLLF